jgi:hypothetical protein
MIVEGIEEGPGGMLVQQCVNTEGISDWAAGILAVRKMFGVCSGSVGS